MKEQGIASFDKIVYLGEIRLGFYIYFNAKEKIILFSYALSWARRYSKVTHYMKSDAIPGMYRHIKNRVIKFAKVAIIWNSWYYLEQMNRRARIRDRVNRLLSQW